MTMTRAIWWSDGDENLNRVSRREGGGEGIETMCTDNYVKISCERSKRRGTARASRGWERQLLNDGKKSTWDSGKEN